MPENLTFDVQSPQITTCSGAACTAVVSSTHGEDATFEAAGELGPADLAPVAERSVSDASAP